SSMRQSRRHRSFRPHLTRLEDRLVPAPVIYVDGSIAANAVHDGKNWATAFNNLQSALDKAAATPGDDQIWIAQGTYTPSKVYAIETTGAAAADAGVDPNLLKTFDLPSGVSLYGGFVSGAKALNQRDPDAHPTVLSGLVTEGGGEASATVHVWHVVTL